MGQGRIDEFFVQPAASDAGLALGAALLGYYNITDGKLQYQANQVYLGPTRSTDDATQALLDAGGELPEDRSCTAAPLRSCPQCSPSTPLDRQLGVPHPRRRHLLPAAAQLAHRIGRHDVYLLLAQLRLAAADLVLEGLALAQQAIDRSTHPDQQFPAGLGIPLLRVAVGELVPEHAVEHAIDVTYGSAIAEFQSIWNYNGLIGLTNGGGALGQSGDIINLFLASDSSFVTLAETPGALSGGLSTIDYVNGTALSMLGVNGAYESNAFFNDNLGLPNDSATLIGSPGTVPAPGALALLGLGGLMGARRRR